MICFLVVLTCLALWVVGVYAGVATGSLWWFTLCLPLVLLLLITVSSV